MPRKSSVTIRDLLLVSCHDFRLERSVFERWKGWVYKVLVPTLKKYQMIHLTYLHPIGIDYLYAKITDPEKWRMIRDKYFSADTRYIKDLHSIPVHRYLGKLYLFGDKTAGALYYAPRELKDEIAARLDTFYDEVHEARVYPVMNCLGKLYPEATIEDAEDLGARMLTTLKNIPPYRSRNRFLDYMLIASLEVNPTITLKELRKLIYPVRARIEKQLKDSAELSIKYVLRHYHALSKKHVLGRIFIVSQNVSLYPVLEVSKEALKTLYGLATITLGSTSIIVYDDYALGSIAPKTLNEFGELIMPINNYIESVKIVVAWIRAPIPFEMYNPITDEWNLERPAIENLIKLVKKYRLARTS
ncbi:hypothetical protein PYJP_01230 [Pyrofollis japonicus]|uniref:hypothetical protein n=1 Tax=Pyrofollis japonicus TaxID=3060460 RepID=UPI00295C1A19|nr:hypothetical protein [Pyrofollis japonicus]BEP16771.1 hypothetical protein PYJP_01230 [Pyrofollis japonicus]